MFYTIKGSEYYHRDESCGRVERGILISTSEIKEKRLKPCKCCRPQEVYLGMIDSNITVFEMFSLYSDAKIEK